MKPYQKSWEVFSELSTWFCLVNSVYIYIYIQSVNLYIPLKRTVPARKQPTIDISDIKPEGILEFSRAVGHDFCEKIGVFIGGHQFFSGSSINMWNFKSFVCVSEGLPNLGDMPEKQNQAHATRAKFTKKLPLIAHNQQVLVTRDVFCSPISCNPG